MGRHGAILAFLRAYSLAAMFPPSCSGTVLLNELEMQPAIFLAMLLAVGLSAASWAGLATAVLAAGGPERAAASSADERWGQSLAAALAQAWALLAAGYQRAPTLVVVLSALLVLPAVALVSFIVHAAAHRKARRAAIHAAELKAEAAGWASEEEPTPISIPVSQQAWLTIEDGGVGTLPLAGQLIRIGRHQDNDVRLADASVHRYHAVIERTAEEAFVITDLSGKDGNGVRVNGERLARAQLIDGDMIELGRARLKFESVPV